MKRIVICLLTVVMLVTMMLPADIAMARGHGLHNQTGTNRTASSSSPKSSVRSALVADFDFSVCSSCSARTSISVTFTDKSTGGLKPYKYAWDFGDGTNSTRRSPSHRYTGNETYTVTLTVADRAGHIASTSETITPGAESSPNVEPTIDGSPKAPPSPSWPRCIDGCTAKEVEITDMWLDVHGCTGAVGNATADIYLTFDNNADRYCFLLVADLYINGNESSKDVYYKLGEIAKGPHTQMAGTINWDCGAKLEVKNITVMWQTNDGGCGYTCEDYSAPSKCYQPTFELSTTPPVIGVAQSSDHPCPGEAVNITAHVTDADGIVTSVNMTYDSTTVPMILTGGTAEDGYWEATILGQPAGTTLTIVVTAEDDDGNTVSTSPHNKTWSEPDCTITAEDAACAYSTGNTASVLNAGTGASYNWTITGGTITAGQGTRSIIWTAGAAGTATISVAVTSPYGCGCSSSKDVTVNANPTVNITPNGGEVTCATTFIILTADTTGSTCTVTSYQWYKDDVALSGETGTTLNVTSPGDYKVEVECANGCTDDDEVTVTQSITKPTATASSNSPVCEGATIELTGGPNGMTTYSWTGPGGWTSSLQNPTRTGATLAMAGTYTLTVTNSNGCSDDESINVTVNAKPTATASSNSPVCEGATIELYGGPNGMTTYNWTGPNGFGSSLRNPTIINATALNAGTYYLNVTDGGCVSDPASTVVVVNTRPTVEAGDDEGACIDAAAFNLTGGSPLGGTWSGTGIIDADDGTFDPATAGVGNHTITYTYANGNGCTNSDTKTVTVYARPAASASSNSPVSQGATIQLTGVPDGMATYSWTGPGGWTSSDQNPTRTGATPAMEGTYTLTVTNSNGCPDDATTNVVVTVPVTPAGGGGGGCPRTDYLTVDWEGCNTSKPLYSNDKLAVDLLGPSLDLSHSLFLKRGTHAPVVDERTYYLIVVRELEQKPATPENTVALVVFNVTPAGAEFDRDIFLTLGLNQTQLPANTLNVTMAYYDDVNGVWETLEYEAGGPNGVAELTLSAPINHFSIYGVLAEVGPTQQPAHFVASGPTIEHSDKKISAFVTKTWETVTIIANIANDGGREGTYPVVLKLNGETVATKTVTLGVGQSQQVTFIRSGLDYGHYDVEVAGLPDDFTVSRTITWWLVILLIVAFALIIWGVLWGRKKRRKAQQET